MPYEKQKRNGRTDLSKIVTFLWGTLACDPAHPLRIATPWGRVYDRPRLLDDNTSFGGEWRQCQWYLSYMTDANLKRTLRALRREVSRR